MLSEREMDALLKAFDARWQEIISEYLTMMGDHLADIGELLPSDANRIVEMRRMGVNLNRIQNQIAYAANQSTEDVLRVFEAVAKSDADFAQKVFGTEFLQPPNGAQMMVTEGLSAALQRTLLAQYEVTLGAMRNLSNATVVSEAYRKAVDVAVQSVQGGVSDYNKAIRRAVENAAAEGLRVTEELGREGGPRVRYASGRSMRLDSAARMNVLDGVRSLQQNIFDQIGEEFGADGVEISAHMLCAEDHLPYQGLQMSRKEFEDLQDSLPRPIGKWNCKHIAHPILLGISRPAYTAAQLREMNKNSSERITIDGRTMSRYEWTQQQRRVETAIRYQKDLSVITQRTGDKQRRNTAQATINSLYDYYDRISEKAGLNTQYSRAYVKGFRAVKVKN